jgi:carboxyl-terminal processing protease
MRSTNLAIWVFLACACWATGTVPTAHAAPPSPSSLTAKQRELNLRSFDYVWETVRDRYWDPDLGGLDWKKVKEELRPRMAKAESMAEARRVLNDMVSRLEVSHFGIIPAEAYKDLKEDKGRGGKAGVDLRVVAGHALVTAVEPGSPADKAGIRPGWEVTRVGDDAVVPKLKSLNKKLKGNPHRRTILTSVVLARFRGRIGEKVSAVFRDGDDREVKLSIPLAQPRGRKVRFGHIPEFYVWIETKMVGRNIGYIRFNAFMDPAHVMKTFNEAMKSYMKADGIIIDVRGNGGGLGGMGTGMIGWLIGDKNPHLGTLILRDQRLKLLVNPRPQTYSGPVVVLIDEMSVSAAEFFASGIQDLGRAHLIGTRTAGAVLGSEIEKLPNGDGFQFAAANYVSRKTGKSLEGIGVTPDQEVLLDRKALLKGKDPALEAALEWIRKQHK